MSALKMLFGKHAPTHLAEQVEISHDQFLNLVEARRGRGKSYGMVRIALLWLIKRLPAMLSGAAPYAKVYTNNVFNLRRMALWLCQHGYFSCLVDCWEFLKERVIYVTEWDQVLTAYDSLILMDEANRNLNVYDSSKDNQRLMLTVHDWLQQTRKHKLTLFFFCQDVEWVKPQLRSLMDRLWRAKRVRNKKTGIPKYFPWYGSDPFAKGKSKDGSLNRAADFKMRFDFDLDIARIYDSWQAIATLKMETRFTSFAEISDYMTANGLKPLPSPTISDALTHKEVESWFEKKAKAERDAAQLAVTSWTTGDDARPAPSLPASVPGGAARGCNDLPEPVDLSSLPVSFPVALL